MGSLMPDGRSFDVALRIGITLRWAACKLLEATNAEESELLLRLVIRNLWHTWMLLNIF